MEVGTDRLFAFLGRLEGRKDTLATFPDFLRIRMEKHAEARRRGDAGGEI